MTDATAYRLWYCVLVVVTIACVVCAVCLSGCTPTLAPSAPMVTHEGPVVATTAPLVQTNAPVVQTTAPLVTTQAPLVTTQAPLFSWSHAPLVVTDLVTRNPDGKHGAIYITGLMAITKEQLQQIPDADVRNRVNVDLRLMRKTIHQLLDRIEQHNKK